MQRRYELNYTESEAVTFGESKPLHLAAMQSRKWVLGADTVYELYQYNFVGSVSSNIDDNNEKTQRKAGRGFFYPPLTSPVYVKFLRQACLPSLLYGAEVYTLTPTLLTKLERCQ